MKSLSRSEAVGRAAQLVQSGDYQEAIRVLRTAAGAHDPDAQLELALLLQEDGEEAGKEEVNKYFASAIDTFKLRAGRGVTSAHYQLGRTYLFGWGIGQNIEKAMSHFSAAAKGDAGVQLEYGVALLFGDEMPLDASLGRELIERACSSGIAEAQYFVASRMATGTDGFDFDPLLAAYWYRLAAEQGHAEAQWNLAQMYQDGRGVETDPELAAYWTRRAAANGYWQAQESQAF